MLSMEGRKVQQEPSVGRKDNISGDIQVRRWCTRREVQVELSTRRKEAQRYLVQQHAPFLLGGGDLVAMGSKL